METGSSVEHVSRSSITVRGIVQGVGFRPFIYHLAHKYGLHGWVYNSSGGVVIEAEGKATDLSRFVRDISKNPPPLAHIESLEVHSALALKGDHEFVIRQSSVAEGESVPVSPDIAVCPDCLRELFDPRDRRFRYPFINCTNCGPRFTITRDIPYDRKYTTMRNFRMCEACAAEYEDPADRRFHAQPNCCPQCGPKLSLWDRRREIECADPVRETQRLLKEGHIAAIKGLGGFHLACDAENDEAVGRLRARKLRTFKPFAVMCVDLDAVRQFCEVNPEEARLLQDPRRPIIVLEKREHGSVSPRLAPFNRSLGVMLPYTPLHYLLLADSGFLALVMTSANMSEEPITVGNVQAREELSELADIFLVHDRDIHLRCDDSVAWVQEGRERFIRRSRGYAPHPLSLSVSSPGILACGADLKNTFCLSKDSLYFLSQHIGDLENLEACRFYEHSIAHFEKFFRIEPRIVAHDLHPDYFSTTYARGLGGKTLVGVQHHHAHIASCMAEHGVDEPVIGVALDGTGYGSDGTIWGGEFLVGDYQGFTRRAHLRVTPLPGADAAVKHPYRMALSFLYSRYGETCLDLDPALRGRVREEEATLIFTQVQRKLNCPLTSSCGRLFDAVSSLIGVRDSVTYEGQAAIELEMIADRTVTDAYSWCLLEEEGMPVVDTWGIVAAVLEDLQAGEPQPAIAARFHQTMAEVVAGVCEKIREEGGPRKVALSGGVFQNRLLLERSLHELRAREFEVLWHQKVPTNDGGICLGQAVIAARTGIH